MLGAICDENGWGFLTMQSTLSEVSWYLDRVSSYVCILGSDLQELTSWSLFLQRG